MANSHYALPTKTIPSLSVESILSDLKEFVALLNKYGIATDNTRINRYVQFLTNLSIQDQITLQETFLNSAKQQPDHPFNSTHEVDHYLYVLREVGELNWIMAGVKVHEPKNLKNKLGKIVSGGDFATLDKASSIARNTQFELRIASYFCQKGYEVTLTNTDIIAKKGRLNVYVECKRVGSSKKLQQRIREAQKQLKRRMPPNTWLRKYYGIIAVDVTGVAYYHNALTCGKTPEHAKDILQDKLREISDSQVNHNINTFLDGRILFLWYQILMPSMVLYPPIFSARFSNLFDLNPLIIFLGRRARKKVYNDVSRVRQDPRSIPSRTLVPRQG